MAAAPDTVAFLMYVGRLKLVPRTGWLQHGVANYENVAAHSFGVATIAMLLGDMVQAPLNIEKALRMALLHDLAEVVTTDLPWSASQLMPRGVKLDMEAAAFGRVVESLPSSSAYQALWDEYAAGASLEARLVKDADRLDLFVQAYIYEWTGYKSLDEFWEHQAEEAFAIAEARTLFAALRRLRDKLAR